MKIKAELPLGTYDAFKDVVYWSEDEAQIWATALKLRADASDQKNLRKIILNLAQLKAGTRAVEIGCGTGALLADLASAVGAKGKVVGFEPQPAFAGEARKTLVENGWSDRAEVREEYSTKLSVQDSFADAAIAQTVLIHLPEQVLKNTLAEMRRIVTIGGRVVSCDQDGDTWTIDHPNRELTRRIIKFNCDQRYADGWTGRHLRRLFQETKLENIKIKTLVHMDTEKSSYLFGMAKRIACAASEVKVISQKEKEQWIADLHETAARGIFFSSINYFVCAGIRVA